MKKPNIGITIGDYNGIGPEVALKSLQNKDILKMCNPFLIASKAVISSLNIQIDKRVHVIESNCEVRLDPGKPTIHSGIASLEYISKGIDLVNKNEINCLVTAPISKTAISLAGSKFKGHTDLLQKAFKKEVVVMAFFSEYFNVSLATIHIPINKISKSISIELITQQIDIINNFLKNYLKKKSPNIGICGLNPHASEDGNIGTEDLSIISPAVKILKSKGISIDGPYPADTLFVESNRRKFDIIHAIYHDQGLVPFKMVAFDKGVNVTLNLPFIRTSPDHGTAYDIAWKNMASPTSMEQAIFLAIKFYNSSTS